MLTTERPPMTAVVQPTALVGHGAEVRRGRGVRALGLAAGVAGLVWSLWPASRSGLPAQ